MNPARKDRQHNYALFTSNFSLEERVYFCIPFFLGNLILNDSGSAIPGPKLPHNANYVVVWSSYMISTMVFNGKEYRKQWVKQSKKYGMVSMVC